ncbi:MAG: FxsA family protein [Thiohalospira sp.]|uniref:FxsA family protein n=1 Tax=Thiohalospira sp. TaxID=3080549 RepID=UPI003980A2C5
MPPLLILLALFVGAPLVELYILIKVGEVIGAGITVLAVIGTAVLGAWLIRAQGLSTQARLRQRLAMGEMPAMEVLEGAALLVAGVTLLTPGFVTDTFGFLLLIPPLRRALIRAAARRAVVVRGGQGPGGGPRTFEGQYWPDEDDDPRFPRR